LARLHPPLAHGSRTIVQPNAIQDLPERV